VLPGGWAASGGSGSCTADVRSQPTPVPDGATTTRTGRRCWAGTAGRSLFVVDVATGELLRQFTSIDGISSPITGGVSLFSGDTGQMATRAFVVDADGVLWRLDMSVPDPTQWTFTPMHDLFWADGALAGQPVYDPPVVSVDNQGNPVVVVGGGDQDNLEGSAPTRVVSVTEIVDHTVSPSPSRAVINWEVRMQPGEQVTGPMVLYANYVYFGTFWSNPDPLNACAYGTSRIWGLHYLNNGGTPPTPYTSGAAGRFPQPGLTGTSGAIDTFYTPPPGCTSSSSSTCGMVFGVGVTQRPNCTTGAGVTDQYLGQRYQISNLRPGGFVLVAQMSGSSASSSATTGSTVQTATIANLPPPLAQSRALSYQPAADF
jgi:type IV pilus assembly protein PilY1